eukprot:CAMPEP_0175450314 /NCGR_PEP_ID=MMETSP0095-20121207/62308_1 /TAXON_ID=311494 /ORGANISM="Alexandrium monilatum, Strain CCMP3105" /LENGTH=133 /DNA_ID=CAMNT_0016750787 /DNA_START=152 /DNA_END=553 /DNA_ORIENTATION=-
MGVGTHRPNEEYVYGQISCPACKSTVWMDRFFFRACSAKISFCIKGESPNVVSISEERPMMARVFGELGKPAIYTMLIIEVDKPGVHPNTDDIDAMHMHPPADSDGGSSRYGSPPPQRDPESGEDSTQSWEHL